MSSLAFTLGELHGGFSKAEGLLRSGDDLLEIEWQTTDSVVGALRSGLRQLEIPFAEIESVIWKRGFFGGKLELELRSMELVRSFPRTVENRMIFFISRQNRDKADRIVKDLRYSLLDGSLDEMLEDLDKTGRRSGT